MKVEFLVLPNGKCPVELFLSTLEDKILAKVYRLIEMLEEKGSLPFPHARKLSGYKNLGIKGNIEQAISKNLLFLLGEESNYLT